MRRRKENGDRCHDCERRKDDQAEPRIGKKYEDQDNCEDVTIMNNAKITRQNLNNCEDYKTNIVNLIGRSKL